MRLWTEAASFPMVFVEEISKGLHLKQQKFIQLQEGMKPSKASL
jgi:hypothetical protein